MDAEGIRKILANVAVIKFELEKLQIHLETRWTLENCSHQATVIYNGCEATAEHKESEGIALHNALTLLWQIKKGE